MVKLEDFDIRLDRLDAVFNAGETLGGTIYVVVSHKQAIKVRDLSVTLVGEAKTNWVNKVSDNIYDSLEPYLNEKRSLKHLLNELTDEKGLLPPGTHRFPFLFELPYSLPSSYESEFGYVRYLCTAEINITSGELQRAMSFRNGISSRNKKMVIEKPISITAQVDVGQLASSVHRCLRKEDGFETYGCCGVRVGHVNAALSVPQSAYVAGQLVPVEIFLENHSRRRLRTPAVVSLVQDVHFRSVSFFQTASDSKTVCRVVDSVQVDNPDRGRAVTKQVVIRIPQGLPASSVGDTIITVAYKLRLEVNDCFEIVLPIGVASKL